MSALLRWLFEAFMYKCKSKKSKTLKVFSRLLRKSFKLQQLILRTVLLFLRSFFIKSRQRRRQQQAGFVLPTVSMVLLVVVLLTLAIMVRSFDRSKNASNVRVDQVVLNAAAPALDRAKAKIEDVLANLSGRIPSDSDLYNYFSNNTYTLGDETRLELVFDFGNGQDAAPGSQPPVPDGKIESVANNLASSLDNDETLTTAWRFPVDTDNNGKFDSYTLYGIYYRSPTRDTSTGNFNRARNPLEARTPPMSGGQIGSQCASATGTSASLVGTSSWYKTGGNLAKSFFVYTATVPITNTNPPTGYETYKGNKGFSALEFQQDRVRIPLNNNAVVFDDDVEITPGPPYRLNGRMITNSNLLAGRENGQVDLYQVSSPYSCYYQEDNSRIVVGGNVANGGVFNPYGDAAPVNVHLFKGAGNAPDTSQQISSTNKSTSNKPAQVSYNSQAYAQRIARLVAAQIANDPIGSTDPSYVRSQVNAVPTSQQTQVRQTQLQAYFRDRTRRVPSLEVPYGGDALGSYATSNPLQGSGDTLRPIDAWMYPTNPSNGTDSSGYTGMSLLTSQLQATQPQQQKQLGTEQYLGDRIQVGNNLPSLWFNNGLFANANTQQNLSNVNWTAGSGTRYRQTRVQTLADLGITDRDGFWEQAAAAKPTTPLDNNGGLRVITGAGVYERKNSFLPIPYYDDPRTTAIEYLTTYDDPTTSTVEQYPMVWPDSMPMSPGAQVFNNAAATPQWNALPTLLPTAASPTIDPNTPQYAKGDLRMRATVLYHYAKSTYTSNTPASYQTPIACISSYYDPTNSTTAANSNNGVVYPPPTVTASALTGVTSSSTTTGLFGAPGNGDENSTTLLGRLYYQANLKFPNGRFVNETLRNALNAKASNQNLTLSQQSAIDSTVCALQILNNTLSPSTTPTPGVTIPNGAIQEITFLDARQIQAIEPDNPSTPGLETFTNDGSASVTQLTGSYNSSLTFSIEQRQPLEIRATQLDMNLLRQQTITGPNVLAPSEYLLPNTGIIYASRDDALLDLSDKSTNPDGSLNMQARQLLSPNDFELDPTRRPNAILLTNGSNLSRSSSFQAAEKGLILATNLPAYVYKDFNLHTQEEFTQTLASDWGNFYSRTAAQINPNFACRQNDPRLPNCTTGDQWRSATVLADSVTLLSNSFQFGFRTDGDYDLRNNNGNWDSINKRLYNGFWNNNFVTSPNFQDSIYSGNSGGSSNDSSYFNNFVTPIQRRVKFPEYVMEICRKLPVSECQQKDWVVTIGGSDQQASSIPIGTLANLLQTGTTATSATNPADQRYVRRVAFVRNSYGELRLTPIGPNPAAPLGYTAIPLGVKSGKISQFPYSSSTVPDAQNNALWFRTTNNTAGNPGSPTDVSYNSSKPLYYSPPSGGKDTLCFTGAGTVDCQTTPAPSGMFNLNLPSSDKASNYTICLTANGNTGSTQAYQSIGSTGSGAITNGTTCPSGPTAAISNAYNTLLNMSGTAPVALTTGNNLTLTATANVNIYDLTGDFADGAVITLLAGTQTNPIFVLRRSSNMKIGVGVTVSLPDGVNPNNVFWVMKASMEIATSATTTSPFTSLVGNFIGNASGNKIGANVIIDGGRFIGFNNAPQVDQSAVIRAVSSTGEPLLVPVLQIQNTNGSPSTNPDPNTGNTAGVASTRWMTPASATTFNIAAAAGDTPSRANYSTYLFESNGGLYNFVRFLENWQDNIPAKISGSFIQLKRSAYATAPWSSVTSAPASPGGIFNYVQGYKDDYDLLTTSVWGNLPYYVAPVRVWGFDVALLSQSPDLFAQKLTLAPTSPPNEFFREVGRDDPWIQALLCAAPKGTSSYAVDADQLPNAPKCPFQPPYP